MSITHFAANAAQRRLTASLVGADVYVSSPTPTVTVGYRLTTAGNEQQSTDGSSWSTLNVWLPSGASAPDYDCIYNATGDLAFMGGSAVNTWVSLAGVRTFTLSNASVGAVVRQVTGTVQIRNASTLVVLATASVILTAEISP